MQNIIVGKREAVSNWIRQFETVVDIENKIYKIQEGFLGLLKWGDNKPLPKIHYVLIFKSLFAKCEACSFEEFENNPNAYFQVSLVHNNNRRIIVQETKNKSKAVELAALLAEGLKIHVKDAVTKAGRAV